MSNYRLVSRSYPTDYWDEHGPEIIDTANELHGDQWSFQESRQLLANGLRTRSIAATGASLRQVWISGLTIALFLIVMQFATAVVLHFIGVSNFGGVAEPGWVQVGALVALVAMSISTRWPTMLIVAVSLGATDSSASQDWIFAVLMGAICITIALAGTGRRVMSPVATLALLALLVASSQFFFVFGPGLLIPAILVASILLVSVDARLAATACIYAALLAISMLVFALNPEPEARVGTTTFGVTTELFIAGVASLIAVALGFAVSHYTRRLRHL